MQHSNSGKNKGEKAKKKEMISQKIFAKKSTMRMNQKVSSSALCLRFLGVLRQFSLAIMSAHSQYEGISNALVPSSALVINLSGVALQLRLCKVTHFTRCSAMYINEP